MPSNIKIFVFLCISTVLSGCCYTASTNGISWPFNMNDHAVRGQGCGCCGPSHCDLRPINGFQSGDPSCSHDNYPQGPWYHPTCCAPQKDCCCHYAGIDGICCCQKFIEPWEMQI